MHFSKISFLNQEEAGKTMIEQISDVDPDPGGKKVSLAFSIGKTNNKNYKPLIFLFYLRYELCYYIFYLIFYLGMH